MTSSAIARGRLAVSKTEPGHRMCTCLHIPSSCIAYRAASCRWSSSAAEFKQTGCCHTSAFAPVSHWDADAASAPKYTWTVPRLCWTMVHACSSEGHIQSTTRCSIGSQVEDGKDGNECAPLPWGHTRSSFVKHLSDWTCRHNRSSDRSKLACCRSCATGSSGPPCRKHSSCRNHGSRRRLRVGAAASGPAGRNGRGARGLAGSAPEEAAPAAAA